MGYKVQFENGHEVEFDSQPTDADIDEAYQATLSLKPAAKSGFMDGVLDSTVQGLKDVGKTLAGTFMPGTGIKPPEELQGAAETGAMVGTGGVAQAAGLVPAGIGALNDLTQGKPADFENKYAGAMDRLTYHPQTEKGQEYGKNVGDVVNRYLLPIAPMAGLAIGAAPDNFPTPRPTGKGKIKGKARLDASSYTAEVAAKEAAPSEMTPPADRPPLPVTPEGQAILSPQDAMFKAEAERKAKLVEAARPVEGRDLTDPFGQMKQQLDTPQSLPPMENPAIRNMVDDLQKPHMTAEEINRAQGAQDTINQRQALMEQEMARNQGLDFNAAERARQERAPIPGLMEARTAADQVAGSVEMTTIARLEQAAQRTQQMENLRGAIKMAEEQKRAAERQEAAQKALAERQSEMEFNVKKQQTLDFNATERARQEAAEVPGLANHMEEVKYSKVMADVVNHPLVKKAEERLRAAEDSLAKAQKDAESGKITKAHLKTLELAVKDMKDSLEWVRSNKEYEALTNARKSNRINSSGRFGRQRGAVNKDLFNFDYFRKKVLSNGTELHLRGGARGPTLDVYKDGVHIGNLDASPMWKGDTQNLEARFVNVSREHRGTGLAKEMYKFLAETGNDIQRSSDQLPAGKSMWDKFEAEGFAKDGMIAQPFRRPGGPGGKQGGWIKLEAPKNNKEGVLSSIPGIKKHLGNIARHFYKTPDEVIEAVKTHKDMDTNALVDQFTKGGQYQKLKTDHPLIHYGVDELIQKDRAARADIRDYVHDELGTAIREVPKAEKADIWALISDADMKKREIDPVLLAKHGATEAQLEVVRAHREVMDYSFEMVNRALRAMGKPEITRRTAYAAMRSTGDFKRLVYDKEGGDVIGVVGSNFRHITNKLAEQMNQKGFFVGEEKYTGGVPRERGSAHEALMHAVEFLAENDPRVKQLVDALDEIRQTEVFNFLNMKTHTMEKKGVFGMEGRKQWKDAYENAIEGFEQQMRFAEGAIRWGHLSEAIANIKRVMDNPEIAKNHPRAVKWMENYIYNSLGFNPSSMGRSLEQAVAEGFKYTGVGYSNVRQAMAVARQTTNAVLLGLNAFFWATQFVQPFQNMPGMKASLIAKGLDAGFDFGTGYAYLGKGAITAYRTSGNGKVLTALERDAAKYARQYHVFGDDLIEHSNQAKKGFVYYANKTSNFVTEQLESSTRRSVFYGLVHMLSENGMSPKNGLFEAAHQLTDMTMVNYSAIERPQIYNHFGPIGDTAINLQNYKHNELSRLFHYVDQVAADKSLRPLAVQLASGIAFAGVMGSLGFAVADELYKYITKKMGTPGSLTALLLKGSEAIGDKVNSVTGAKAGEPGDFRHVLSHGGPALVGMDMSKRLGMTDVVPDGWDILFPGQSKLVSIGAAGVKAAMQPTEMNAKRFVREASPGILTGVEDRAWFSKTNERGEQVLNRKTLESNAVRNDADKVWKTLGGTGVNESVQKQKRFEENHIMQAYAENRKVALERMRDAVFTKGKVDDADVRAYLKAQGSPQTLEKDIEKYRREQNFPAYQLDILRSSASTSMARLKHAQRLLEMYRK